MECWLSAHICKPTRSVFDAPTKAGLAVYGALYTLRALATLLASTGLEPRERIDPLDGCGFADAVSPSLHTHLDLYATYVITLSKDSLKEVVKILEEANQVWDYAVNELGQKKTPRTITVRSLCPIAGESCAVTTVISSVGEPRPNRREVRPHTSPPAPFPSTRTAVRYPENPHTANV